jgi:hypothetical protein
MGQAAQLFEQVAARASQQPSYTFTGPINLPNVREPEDFIPELERILHAEVIARGGSA